MERFCILQGDESNLDLIRSLWEKLNQIHFHLSPHFKNRYKKMNWDNRRNQLLRKSSSILLEYVVDKDIDKIVGYCISSVANFSFSLIFVTIFKCWFYFSESQVKHCSKKDKI